MSDDTYSGYPNYQTWAVALWMDNDQGSQEYWQEQAQSCWDNARGNSMITTSQAARYKLADMLKTEHEENTPDTDGVYSDLLNSALGKVDWYFIADNLLEDVEGYESKKR